MPTFGSSRQASHNSTRAPGRDSRGRFTRGGGGVIIDGLDEVATQFRFLAGRARPGAGAIVVKHAEKAADRMRTRVPVGPPSLHVLNSITSDPTPTLTPTGAFADAGPDPAADRGAFVARFLERGTVKQAPKPFAGPAGDESMPDFLDDMRRLAT